MTAPAPTPATEEATVGARSERALKAVVVVPALDEEVTIGACLYALAHQRGVAQADYCVVLVLNPATSDATRALAVAAAAETGLWLEILPGPGGGPGPARGAGMDLAASLLPPTGLIASTDADSVVAQDWLAHQLVAVAGGADAVGGYVDLDPAGLHPFVLEHRAARAAERLAAVHAHTPTAEHHHFAGASMSLTAAAYHRLGPLDFPEALEDEALERALRDHGLRIDRLLSVRVTTSSRLDGRAPVGLAHDLRATTALIRAR